MSSYTSRRVLIVGWDGATFDLIKPWAEAGYMPSMARLLVEGAHRVLNSTVPCLSPPAWTSFFTGKNPGRHGTFDFIRRRPGTYELQTVRNHLPSLGTLFHWISQAGRRVGVINVPLTYPPEQVNGFMVSGLGAALEWEFTYPAELREELLAYGYRIENPIDYRGDNDEAYLDAALMTTRKRAEVSLRLLETQQWDLFMVVFTNIDQVLSFLWHHIDPTHPRHDPARAHVAEGIIDLHRFLDSILGRMLEIVGEDVTILVASDHGMGPLYKEVFLNSWLGERGYLVKRRTSSIGQQHGKVMRSVGLTREGIWRRLGRGRTQRLKQLLPERFHGLVPTEHPSLADQIDWSRTKAYNFGNIGQIYVNLEGREPQGIVKPGWEYDSLVAELIDDLQEVTDPETGVRLVDSVYRREELYDGPFLEAAPDLNVVMKNYSYVTQMRRELAHGAFTQHSPKMSGFHRREGILVARGPDVQSGHFPPCNITDVTPTVLYLMGLGIPDDMDGMVISEIFTRAFRERFPVERVATSLDSIRQRPDTGWDESEEREILRRLEGHGYLG